MEKITVNQGIEEREECRNVKMLKNKRVFLFLLENIMRMGTQGPLMSTSDRNALLREGYLKGTSRREDWKIEQNQVPLRAPV